MDGENLFRQIETELDLDRMVRHIEAMSQWHRYTGTPQGERFVDDLTARLAEASIPCSVETYDAYTSLPLSASLTLDSGETLGLIGDVFSGEAADLRGELVYDRWSEQKRLSANEELRRLAAFRGKLVLSRSGGGAFAEKILRAGGLGLLHISPSRGGYIHHSNVDSIWGTPCPSDRPCLGELPAAGISREDGERLIARLESGAVTATLRVRMDTAIRRSRMPVVDIPGRRAGFVLLHGHYDSWYEGITDNAGSDAILLELARAFWRHRDQLERGVRIAWWSGHSDARYAGSAWYCDRHWEELRRGCVASVNLDLTGCRLARQIRARTTCMEGEALTAGLIQEFTGMAAKPYIPMIRGGDQSFWGVGIPIHIMFKYEPVDEERVSPCPSGGPWWHTDQDTLDKLDPAILLRDAKINGKLVSLLLNSPRLPVRLSDFTERMEAFLREIQGELSADFSLEPALTALAALRPWCQRLERALEQAPADSDGIWKSTAGELVRLVYTSGSPYGQDPAEGYAPFGALARARGMTRDNTPPTTYLFEQTAFRRACNRLCGQMAAVGEAIRRDLKGMEAPAEG